MKRILFSFLLMTTVVISRAQVGPYTFSVQQQPYQHLTGTTSLNQGSVWDDPTYTVPLSFTMHVFSDSFTEVIIDGNIGLGATVVGLNGSTGVLFWPYASDIIDKGYLGSTSLSPISYKTEGSAGNKITKIEWRNVGFYNELMDLGTTNDSMHIQFWLYENGDFEYRMGPGKTTISYDPHDGFAGPLIGVIDSFDYFSSYFNLLYYLFGNPANPVVKSVDPVGSGSVTSALSSNPPTGTVYRFHIPGVGIGSDEMDLFLNVTPTLASEKIIINWNLNQIQNANVTIMDIQGRVQFNKTLPEGLNEINISDYIPGNYILVIEANNVYRTAKFVKQ